MMDIKQINSAIMFGTLTNTELNSIIDAVKFARNNLTKQAKRSFTVGSTVKFTSTKRGLTIQGTVEKVAIKFVTVRDPVRGLWKVPASMLEAV
jgi:hypothetical protein